MAMSSLPNPYYDRDGITIYNADCREILPLLPNKSVELVLTDPPYQFQHVDGGGFRAKYPLWQSADFQKMTAFQPQDYVPIIASCQSITNMVFFSSRDSLVRYAELSMGHKFDIHILWKPNGVPFTNNTFKSDVEYLCLIYDEGRYFAKGMVEKTYSKVTTHILGSTLPRAHPTEKPLQLLSKYILILSSEGSLVLDPFMGSGTTLVAAKQLGRKCIGIEIEEKYCEIAVKRLSQEVMRL